MLGAAMHLGGSVATTTVRAVTGRVSRGALSALDVVLAASITEEAVDRAMASRLTRHALSRALEGPLVDVLAEDLVRFEVVERVVERLLADGTLERVVERTVDSRLSDRAVALLLASDELWTLVDEVAQSPAVADAISRQSAGLAEQVAGDMRTRSRNADAKLERAARRVLRRPAPS